MSRWDVWSSTQRQMDAASTIGAAGQRGIRDSSTSAPSAQSPIHGVWSINLIPRTPHQQAETELKAVG